MKPLAAVACAVLLTLVLAGCAAPDAGKRDLEGQRVIASQASQAANFVGTAVDGTLVDPALLTGIPPLLGVQRFIGHQSYEPSLGITPKGSIFMSGLSFSGLGDQPVSAVLATFDQGATWKDVTPKLPTGTTSPPVSFDPFVMVDPVTGRVFSADLQALACNYLTFSDDEGKTWTSNPLGCGLPLGGHDHQSIITGKSRGTPTVGYDRMVYYCVNRVGDTSCAASVNGGLTFGPLVPVFLGVDVESGGLCGGLAGHVKTDSAGRVFLPKGQCGIPSVGVSEDDGVTWTTYEISRSAGIMGHEVNLATDAKDNVYAFWIGDNGLPYLSMSKDHGKTWSLARRVSPPGMTAADKPAIAASAEGKVAFAYVGTDHPKGYTTRNWTGAVWHAYIGVLTDALGENPIVLTTMVDSPDDPIARNQCGGTRCQGLYDFIDVDIDANGRPWASLVDVCHAECNAKTHKNDVNQGFAGTLATGPALTDAGGALPALPVLPAVTKA